MRRYGQAMRVWLCPAAGERPHLPAGVELTDDLDACTSRNDQISITMYGDFPLLVATSRAWLVVHVAQREQATATPVVVCENTVIYGVGGRDVSRVTTEFLRTGSDVPVPLAELPPKV